LAQKLSSKCAKQKQKLEQLTPSSIVGRYEYRVNL